MLSNQPISLQQALEWEVSRLSLFGMFWVRVIGYEKFAMKVAKRYDHYIKSHDWYVQEKNVAFAKKIISNDN